MEQLKEIVNSSLFKSAAIAFVGLILIAEKHPLYAGVAFGFALREFFLVFKQNG